MLKSKTAVLMTDTLRNSNRKQAVFLSYVLNQQSPSYGGKETFELYRTSQIERGDTATNSKIHTSVHLGTHIDLPSHFHAAGQTISDYPASFWIYTKPLLLEIDTPQRVVKYEIIDPLEKVVDDDFDILLVKTGMGSQRSEAVYWQNNCGFHAEVYDYLQIKFPSVRIFGFDSISVSSYTNREIGREAHRKFLNPGSPVLLLEDMNLAEVDAATKFTNIVIAPLLIESCEALPCTVIGILND